MDAVIGGQLGMQRNAASCQFGNFLKCGTEIAVDVFAKAGGLLNGGIFWKHEQLRAGLGGRFNPVADLVFPLLQRGRLADGVLGGSNADRAALAHVKAPSSRTAYHGLFRQLDRYLAICR